MAYEDIPSFHIADYVIFAASILFSLGIGIYHGCVGGQQKTTAEYLVGNKKMKIFPVAMSLVVSFESSIMMLGLPAETYLYGFQLCFASIAWFISSIIASYVFVPMLHKVNLTSVFEYMEKRFNSTNVRIIGNALQTISYLIYMGIVLFGPAIALEAVTGFPLYASIITIAVIAMVYTSLGGIKAVVWTDFFQCAVMIIGILAVLIKGTMAVGGVGEVIRRNQNSGRLTVIFDPNPHLRFTIWTVGFATVIRFLNLAFNQASFQRISSTPTAEAAKKVYLVSAPGFLIFSSLACIEGLVGYAYFEYKGCDPLESGRITNSNQIVILMVLELFESTPGMAGLFLAALFSASLSTLSSGMGSVSANFWEDIVKPRIRPISEGAATLIAKFAVLGCGLISITVSFLIAEVGGSLAEISSIILGAVGAPLAGLQIIAAIVPSVHSRGAIIATVVSFVVTCWLSFSKVFYKHLIPPQKLPPAPVDQCTNLNTSLYMLNTSSLLYQPLNMTTPSPVPEEDLGYKVLFTLSPYLYSPLGVVLTMVVAMVASHILGTKEEDKVDEMFLTPYIKQIWCCSSYISKYIKKSESYEEMKSIHTEPDTVLTHKEDGHSMIEMYIQPKNQDIKNPTQQERLPVITISDVE